MYVEPVVAVCMRHIAMKKVRGQIETGTEILFELPSQIVLVPNLQ